MRRNKQSSIIALAALLTLALTANTFAASTSSSTKNNQTGSSVVQASTGNLSGSVTQSYNADSSVQPGMVVQLKAKDPTTVVPVTYADIKDMLGIVVPTNSASIVLTPQNISQQQVLVATTGHYDVLVSNQNGPIKTGDYLTISALAGVAMKADQTESEVIGKAAGNFTGSANVIGSVKLTKTDGEQTTVALGQVPLDLTIAHNPLVNKQSDFVPGFLAKAANTVADKPVSADRIYLSLVILLISSLLAGNILYSGIRSGMIAIGRNPLIKKSILKSLVETVVAGLIIFIVGIFAVYLLLKL